MKFVRNEKADKSLDLVCRMCPMHILEPGDKLKCMTILAPTQQSKSAMMSKDFQNNC